MTHHSNDTQILGKTPRIEPLSINDISGELLAIVRNMISVNEALDARGKSELTDLMAGDENGELKFQQDVDVSGIPEILRTMLRHPSLFVRQIEMGIQLLGQGALAARDRELAILRIGWLCQAPYEWGEHVHVAKSVGIVSEEIERITLGSSVPGWSEKDAAILKATEELYSDAMISDDTWAVLERHFTTQQLIELPIVVGQYQTVAYYQNSLRLRLHEGNEGLRAR